MNKNKISLIIIFSIILITLSSFISAYDISIDSLGVTNTNPPMVNTPGNIKLIYSNIGANDFTTSSGVLVIDFGDGSTENVNMAPLTNSSPLNEATVLRSHTYTAAGTYTISATYSGSGDTNSANNVLTTQIQIMAPVLTYDFTPSSYDYQIVQGFSELQSGQLINTGTASPMVKLQLNGDLISGSDIFPASNIDVNIVGVSGNSFLLTAGNYKNIDFNVHVDSNQATGVYTGLIELVDANTGTQYETAPITITVLDNGMYSYVNYAPVIDPIQTQTINVNTEFQYDVQASDANNDPIYYSLVQAPAGMHINTNTGHIYGWIPTMQTTETIIVKATDLINSSTEQFDVVVQPGSGTNSLDVNPSEIHLGGSNQDREQFVTETFTITNPGSDIVTLSSVDLLTPSGSASLPSIYDPQPVSLSSNTINPGDSVTATVTAYVPADFDGQEVQIGLARILGSTSGGSTISQDVDMFMEAKSYLEITEVEFKIDGQTVNEDELVEGEDIEVIATIKNLYDTSNSDINDVYFTLESNDWNVDEHSSSKTLHEGEDDEFTVTFNLDTLVSPTTTTFTLKAYGDDDDNNFQHVAEYTVNVEVERQDDDIRITTAEFDDDTISPNTLSSEVQVEVSNYGNDDQDDVEITVESITSSISYSHTETVDIDSGDSVTKTFNIALPGNLAPGNYQFRVRASNDHTSANSKTITLTVISSTVITPNTGSSGSNTGGSSGVTVNPGLGSNSGSQGVIANPTYGQSASDIQRFTDSDAFIVLLLALGLVVLILFFIMMLVASVRRKKRIRLAKRRAAIKRRQRQSIQIK